ncbi:MAG: efflux RND transporter permease subunit, partial [Gemmataceae bacterium]
FMQGAAQALFVPLALAVGFAMIFSYILSSSFVPVLSVWLLRHHERELGEGEASHSLFDRFARGYAGLLGLLVKVRWLLVPAYLALAGVACWFAFSQLGREIFPQVDTGQFQVRLKAPVGTRIERTEDIARCLLETIASEAGPDNVAISLGYVGLIPSSYPINNIFLFMSGPEEAMLRVALRKDSGVSVADLKEKLRQNFPAALAKRLREEGLPADKAERMVSHTRISFEPADIVNEVMSFGSPTPIEIAVNGPDFHASRAFAEKVRQQLLHIDTLRDLQYVQPFDYPTVEVKIDRERAGLSGVTVKDVADSVVTATSSSRFVVPVYWADPVKGIGYQVQVQVPIERMDSAKEIAMIPIRGKDRLLVRDVAAVQEGTMPGEFDRYNMSRLVSLTANVEGEDLGRVAEKISRAIAAAGSPPRGVEVHVRGQLATMKDIFGGLGGGPVLSGLTAGLILSVLVILLLLTAYFQSVRLALIVILTVPAVIAGTGLALLLTGSTLNIQSFMGTIMAIGVAVANSILLVTFAEAARRDGLEPRASAVDGARHRLRPILMTSCAMIAGMLPLALGLGEGGDQVAPLGRAVIGGLLAATLTTLFVLPALFALVQARASSASVSLDPDDPVSPHFESAS